MKQVDALIIGGGPAGLSAAIALRRSGLGRVLVVDREEQAGGIPRHCNHTGFGLRDMRRVLSGPGYARRYVQRAEKAGVEIQTSTTVTEWTASRTVRTTSPSGIEDIQAEAVVLATGCRERPRSARLIPGTRAPGIFTTGSLQQWVYLHPLPVGKRAVVVGAEHVSFSAVMTLRHAGVEVVAMITEYPRHQSNALFKLLSADRWRVSIITEARIANIFGRERVTGVEISGEQPRTLDCDTVVFTGNWIPDYELARLGGLALDPHSSGPQIDTKLRTSEPGIFSVGNLNHAAETADIAALSGRSVAEPLLHYLDKGTWRDQNEIPVMIQAPVQWISPHMISPDKLKSQKNRFYLRVAVPLHNHIIEFWQADRLLWHKRFEQLMPNLPIHISPRLGKRIEDVEPVRVVVRDTGRV